jgi:hypothetical protein
MLQFFVPVSFSPRTAISELQPRLRRGSVKERPKRKVNALTMGDSERSSQPLEVKPPNDPKLSHADGRVAPLVR